MSNPGRISRKDIPMNTKPKYSIGDYVKIELSPTEGAIVTILAVHDGHYDTLEYSAEEIHGELYMDESNHRLIGR